MRNAPAGWYAEPRHSNRVRYWDGQQWTQWTSEINVEKSAPNKAQIIGNNISALGANITWIVIGSAIVLLLLLLII